MGKIPWTFYANAVGECDTCHIGPVNVYREDTDEGWQECERCDTARQERRERRRREQLKQSLAVLR